MKDVINKLLKSIEIAEIIDRIATENQSFEEKCNTFCKSFDIITKCDPNGVFHIFLVFDIIKPLAAEDNERILYSVAAEITKNNDNLRLIYIRSSFSSPYLSSTKSYVERYIMHWFAEGIYVHTLDEINCSSSVQVKRLFREIIPHIIKSDYLDDFKDMITPEEISTIQMLQILGKQRFSQIEKTNDQESFKPYVLAKNMG
jgi:hypothetical protein